MLSIFEIFFLQRVFILPFVPTLFGYPYNAFVPLWTSRYSVWSEPALIVREDVAFTFGADGECPLVMNGGEMDLVCGGPVCFSEDHWLGRMNR